jgi:outer membrane protein OmpA-like peptidoglycan-associated protein
MESVERSVRYPPDGRKRLRVRSRAEARAEDGSVDTSHSLSPRMLVPACVSQRINTMTSFARTRTFRTALLTGLLALGSAAAQAQPAPSEADILKALSPAQQPLTRSLSIGPRSGSESGAIGEDRGFLDSLRNRTSFSPAERERIAAASADKQSIDLEIPFDYASATIGPKALPLVKSLGGALAQLKNNTFLVVGHTDGKGHDKTNQALSERRAEAVRQYIIQNYGVPPANIVAVGYGKSRPKDSSNPLAAVNRRVTAVNMSAVKSASRF